METRRAYFRNMRSKCRCSCVLQFTRHLGVSSVLHRPLSQIIHCIVLYLGFQTFEGLSAELSQENSANNWQLDSPSRGRSQLTTVGGAPQETLNTQCAYPEDWSEPQPDSQGRQTYRPANLKLCCQSCQTGQPARNTAAQGTQ